MVCPHCQGDAACEGLRPKTFLTPNGEVTVERAYYHCTRCHQGHFPFDQANRLQKDRLSTGLRPLVCLAGVLESFRDGADDILRRFAGVRLSASSTRAATTRAGEQLLDKQRAGGIVRPTKLRPWNFRLQESTATVGYLGVDAFSVPMQKPGGGKAESRMMYIGRLYTPDKSRSLYLVDFDLDQVVGQMRQAAIAYGFDKVEQVVVVSDAGNGLEAALHRHFWDNLPCVLDWFHAVEHLHSCADTLYPKKDGKRQHWFKEAETVLWEQGGTGLQQWLARQQEPEDESAKEGLRSLRVYVNNQGHRMDYPAYRERGWDIGSGPTEAGCKVTAERLRGSGMRWREPGAARVAPLRALYMSGPEIWDAYWALALAA
jgi:uncharacterized protein UPF0236